MRDEKKFKAIILLMAVLCAFSILYAISEEFLMPEIEGYLKRRLYYERVISQKGLSLKKALYWDEKK
ncbi:MAG: hypothetical protein HY805_08265 [Nitrospirae bacterium]|nr:hypothetical protein [Nitrospirota bacterium]